MSNALLGWLFGGWTFAAPGKSDDASVRRGRQPSIDADTASVKSADEAHTEERTEKRTEERVLLERLHTGDTQAFAILVAHHMSRVTRFAIYLLGSNDAAEDVAQAVFIRLWERRSTIDLARPLRPYLLRAVQNQVFNERRAESVRAKYRDLVRAGVGSGVGSETVPSPEDAVLTSTMVQDALRQLPDRRQLALRLWLEDGLTDPEIAQTLGISLGAVDRLIRRALADVRAILLVSKEMGDTCT